MKVHTFHDYHEKKILCPVLMPWATFFIYQNGVMRVFFFFNLINECVNSAYILHKLHFRYDTGQHLKSKQLKDAAEIQTLWVYLATHLHMHPKKVQKGCACSSMQEPGTSLFHQLKKAYQILSSSPKHLYTHPPIPHPPTHPPPPPGIRIFKGEVFVKRETANKESCKVGPYSQLFLDVHL